MLKYFFLFFFIAFNGITVYGQKEIDYHNKALLKTLKKFEISNISELSEMTLQKSESFGSNINGKYFRVKNKNKVSHIEYIYVGRVNSCRAGGCAVSNISPENAKSEYFDYFILFDANKAVRQVKVFNYQATHGQEISATGWLKQFIGFDGKKELRVDKEIDAISGATISVYAITADVEAKTKLLENR